MKTLITAAARLRLLTAIGSIGLSAVLAGAPVTASAQLAPAVDGKLIAIPAKAHACTGCHGIPGYKGGFPEVYQVPKIGGQNAAYIESALRAYAKGDRRHPSMRSMAQTLTEQDITEIAAFYSAQK